MTTIKSSPHASLFCVAVLSQISCATAQNLGSIAAPPVQPLTEGRLLYTGNSAQISVGLSHDAKLHGEISGVLHESATHAWLGEAWSSRQEGGIKFSHHQHTTPDSVRKLFIAADQNASRDQKITFGYGLETAHWFGQINLSQGLTGRRLVGQQENSTDRQNSGQVDGQQYLDLVTTTTRTRLFEKAYDHGIGLRFGHHLENRSIRLTAGLDHEWGQQKARQNTTTLIAEKMYPGTPHSIALQLIHSHKTSSSEPTRNDTRTLLIYRHSLGRSHNAQPERLYRLKPVVQAPSSPPVLPTPAPTLVAPPKAPLTRIEKQWVKTKASMSADAFFEFDSARLTPDAMAELQRVAQLLQTQGREGPIQITGHTCDIGSDRVNDRLSLARALSVKNQLVALGIASHADITAQGRGKRAQKYPATAATRAQNRRVELEFFSFVNQEKFIEITTPAPTPEPVVITPTPIEPPPPAVIYEREIIAQPPAWVQRALRTPTQHKRNVSVYRIKETSQTESTQRKWINQAPTALNDTYTLESGSTTALDVMGNDSDPDKNDNITLVQVTPPTHGQVSIDGRQVIYRASATHVGPDSFSYTIQDNNGLQATGQVRVLLTQANRAPQANPDHFGVSGRTPSLLAVLDNDTEPDGDALVITSVTQPIANSGKVEIVKNGVYFTPNYPFLIDWFTYTITDGRGASSTATVRLVDP